MTAKHLPIRFSFPAFPNPRLPDWDWEPVPCELVIGNTAERKKRGVIYLVNMRRASLACMHLFPEKNAYTMFTF